MMTTKTILSLLLGLSLAACVGNTEPDDGTTKPQAAQPPAASGAAAEYAISCQGDVTKKGFSSSLSPRCVGGAPGTRGCESPCAAQDVQIKYVPPAMRCGSVERFVWDGTTCKKYLTNDGGEMRCTGNDCELMFTTEAACQTAYETCTAK